MKICLVILAILVVNVSANPRTGEGPTVNGYLIRRAQSIQEVLESNINLLKSQGNGPLATTLEHQLEIVKNQIVKLQKNQDETEKHVIEENLLRLENRVMEELISIEIAKHHVTKTHTAEVLISQAEDLMKRANDVLKHVPAHDRDYDSAVHEVKVIQMLVNEIKSKPAGTDLKKQEIQLVKHEQTLKVLLERLSVHLL